MEHYSEQVQIVPSVAARQAGPTPWGDTWGSGKQKSFGSQNRVFMSGAKSKVSTADPVKGRPCPGQREGKLRQDSFKGEVPAGSDLSLQGLPAFSNPHTAHCDIASRGWL